MTWFRFALRLSHLLAGSALLAVPALFQTGCAQGLTSFGGGCGDGTVDWSEVCDGAKLAGASCASLGLGTGALACNANCTAFDTSGCTAAAPICGDGLAEGSESCDGLDLRGETCVSQGFDSGGLACNASCIGFDTNSCAGAGAVCGNGVAEGTELCDGGDLRGATCAGQGFDGGALACNGSCSALVTSGCTTGGVPPQWICDPSYYGAQDGCDCGCGAIDLDCADASIASCDYNDCSSGTPIDGQNWLCDGGSALCGNDLVEGAEVCDGIDLAGSDCTTVAGGFTGGALNCAVDCTAFDTSACSGSVPVGWACDPAYYGAQDGCDCACGAWDPDCNLAGQTLYGCNMGDTCVQPGVCQAGGGTWLCDPTWYGVADGCDCGCGIIDTDCSDGSLAACDYNDCSSGTPMDGQNWLCEAGGTWTCDATWYGAGDGCDCGCGVIDTDCADGTLASCDYNDCSIGSPVDGQNWLCQ